MARFVIKKAIVHFAELSALGCQVIDVVKPFRRAGGGDRNKMVQSGRKVRLTTQKVF